MTLLYFTIDTEYEPGFTARHGPASREANFARSIRGQTADGDVGVFYQMDVFDRYGLKAVFFVDPMPALLWGTGAIAEIVEPILERGHDVQLHLHSEWLALAGEANPLGARTGTNLKDFAYDEQCELIEWARRALMAAGAPRPVAFRAGNFGANDDTLRALATLGFTHDTSYSPGFAASSCAIGLGPEHRRPIARRGVIEVPVGCIEDVAQGLRHTQLTALSLRELVGAVRHARDHEINDLTLVSHSFELLCRDRRRINRIVKRRFDRLCESLGSMRGVGTTTYALRRPQAQHRPYPRPALPKSPVRTGIRLVEQAVANAIYGGR